LKSFRKIFLVVTVLVVLFLLIGFPGNAANNTSDATRTLTMQPSVSMDQNSDSSNQGRLSTFQSSLPLLVQSSQLNIGTESGTGTITLNNNEYEQIYSQYTNTLTTFSKSSFTYGQQGDNDHTATQTYNESLFDESESELFGTPEYVSYESSLSGTTTNFPNAQSKDNNYETLDEGTSYGSVPTQFDDQLHTSGGNVYELWIEDGFFVTCSKNEILHINSWDTTTISGTINSVDLYVNYTVEAGYNSLDSHEIQYKTDSTWQDTGIEPQDGHVGVVDSSNLSGINSVSELQSLNVMFDNDDVGGPDPVYFEKIWLVISMQSPEYRLDVIQEISGVSTSAFNNISIYGYRSDENFTVQVFTTGGSWVNIELITGTSGGWYNYTINPVLHIIDDNHIFLRYIDTNSTSDSTQSNLQIDAAFLETKGYELDFYYTFQWTGNPDNVANISVYDVSNGSQDMNAYIGDVSAFPSITWVSLDFSMDSSISNHSKTLSESPTNDLNRFFRDLGGGQYEIRIRYAESSSDSSASLKVDYLAVQLHFPSDVGGGVWELDMVYNIQDFSGDRSEVTQITVNDYSNVTVGAIVETQIFDFINNQWVSCFSIVENSETQHNVTFSSSPSNYISSNPGDIKIRYILTGGGSDSYSIDYLEVIVETEDGGGGGGGSGDEGTSDGGGGGGGDGGTTVIRTLSAIS
jgi:hypothetical protein